MCIEYAKAHRQDLVSATGCASAHNVMEEYAAVTEELIENLTKKYTKQIEALIKSNTDAMANLIESFKKTAPAPAASAISANLIDAKKTA
jgi:hypothetical protein